MRHKIKSFLLVLLIFLSANNFSPVNAQVSMVTPKKSYSPLQIPPGVEKQAFLDQQLYNATKRNNLDEVNHWLKESANPNTHHGKHQNTPLHRASKDNNLQIAKLLVDNGANVRIKNGSGITPMHYAWFYKSVDVFYFLRYVLRATAVIYTRSV